MRVALQRVSSASVQVGDTKIASIGPGLVLLVGVTGSDGAAEVEYLARKIAHLRIFPDEAGKMNRSALDQRCSLLVVSQFTLFADVRKGRRPSFIKAARPDVAEPVVDEFAEQFRQFGLAVETGQFGAEMAVELVNDGPVTIWLDTDELIS